MNRRHSILLVTFAAIAVALLAPSIVQACPGCKENLPNGPTGSSSNTATVAQGYAWSIYLMLGVMITLLGSMGGAAFFFLRKAAKRGQL